jgi:peptidoglycan hydrolase-like protein with peptidoglycan-binding domain
MTEQIILSLKYTEGYWFYGENNIMDKDTNPIPVTEVLPKGILTIEVPYYTKDVSLDEVNIGLESAQKYLNVYNPLLNLREDGYMDIATENAIKQFQQDMGLYPSGIYNLQTSQKMYDDYMSKLENHLFDNQIQFLLT